MERTWGGARSSECIFLLGVCGCVVWLVARGLMPRLCTYHRLAGMILRSVRNIRRVEYRLRTSSLNTTIFSLTARSAGFEVHGAAQTGLGGRESGEAMKGETWTWLSGLW